MLLSKSLMVLALPYLASAACRHFIDNYDTTEGLTGVIPELSPVNVSSPGALQYHALDYVTGPGQLVVAFPSPPNVIGAGALSIPREGHMPSWNLKPNSGYKYFNQKSVSFICVTNLQNSVAPPTSCHILAAGKKLDGSFVYHSLIFNSGPNQDIPGNFSEAVFPSSFSNLVEMDLSVMYSDQPQVLVAQIYDDNEYEACT